MRLYAACADLAPNAYADFAVKTLNVTKEGNRYRIDTSYVSTDFLRNEVGSKYIQEDALETWYENATCGGEVFYSLNQETCITAIKERKQEIIDELQNEVDQIANSINSNEIVIYGDEEEE